MKFPSKIQFHSKAEELQKAVSDLPEPQREMKPLKNEYVNFIEELRKLPQEKLKRLKLRRHIQAYLPYVLSVSQEDRELQGRVTSLIVTQFEQMPPKTQVRVLGYGLELPDIRKCAYAFFSRNPPTADMPKWLTRFWKKVLRPEEPSQLLANILKEHQVSIIHTCSWLGLNPCMPISDKVYEMYIEKYDMNLLRKEEFSEILAFLRSSVPVRVRGDVLAWILQTYVGRYQDSTEIPKAIMLLLRIALEFWGKPFGLQWRKCSPHINRYGTWVLELDQRHS